MRLSQTIRYVTVYQAVSVAGISYSGVHNELKQTLVFAPWDLSPFLRVPFYSRAPKCHAWFVGVTVGVRNRVAKRAAHPRSATGEMEQVQIFGVNRGEGGAPHVRIRMAALAAPFAPYP